MLYYIKDPKRDPNFDNHPHIAQYTPQPYSNYQGPSSGISDGGVWGIGLVGALRFNKVLAKRALSNF